MLVKLQGYAPDADPVTPGILTQCSGVVPSLKGIKGAPSAAITPLATLAATCQGAVVLSKLDSSTRFFAGTGTKLYEAGTSTWNDVSRAAGAYTMNSTQRWRYAQLGNVSIAANGNDTVQASVSTGAFSCVPGAPIAALVETVGAFVFAANTSIGSNIIQWAGINGYTSWTPSIATQAGQDTLTATEGPITAVKRFGNAVVVYKKRSMFLGIYAGPPNIWTINANQIPGTVGAMSAEAVVNIGTPENPKHIFMGEDNFYIYDGAKPVPIGDNFTKNTVFGALLQSRFYACSASHDRVNNLVRFYYPVSDSVNPDHCVVYNYRTGRWGVDDRQIEAALEYVTPGITYGGLGGFYNTYADLPALPYGSAFLNAAQPLPGIFDTAHTVKTLTGVAGTTSFTTGDYGDDVQVICMNRIRPRFITSPSSATLTHQYRMSLGDSFGMDSAVSLSSSGAFDVLRESRWHRDSYQFMGDWEMTGFSPEFTEGSLE